MAAASEFAVYFGISNKTFWLFDSFHGFPPTGPIETDFLGKEVKFQFEPKSSRPAVEKTLSLADADTNQFRIVEGFVEETLKAPEVKKISMLRLDTDYEESTRVELEGLYPRLSNGGVLIVDDYGHFEGVRKATDDFFDKATEKCLLHRIDYTCRSGVKLTP